MKKKRSAQLLDTMYYILTVSESVDKNGNNLPIREFPRALYTSTMSLLAKIEAQLEVKHVKEGAKDKLIKFGTKPPAGYTATNSYVMNEGEIEFKKQELDAFKYFYEKRDTLPRMNIKTAEDLEQLINS